MPPSRARHFPVDLATIATAAVYSIWWSTIVAAAAGGTTSGGLPTFPNIEYTALGYDVVQGNPLSTLTDPGWKEEYIFDLTFNSNNTYDGKYSVPDYLNVVDTSACSYQGSSYTMSDASSYQVWRHAVMGGDSLGHNWGLGCILA
jgi:hypothetical protein